jgi:nucleotide-binding universal stress UspA family protein
VALEVARELDVSPWDALLLAVRRAAGRVAWVDEQLTAATHAADGDLDGSRPVARWLNESRRERALLARTAKAAVDAGVAERLVRQVELEGRVVAEVLARVLDRLELDPDTRVRAFGLAQDELLVLDAAQLEGDER